MVSQRKRRESRWRMSVSPKPVREVVEQPAGDLLRRPLQRQLRLHVGGQSRGAIEHRRLRTCRQLLSSLLGLPRPIAVPATVVVDLPGDRARMPIEPRRNLTERVAPLEPAADLFPLRRRQVTRRTILTTRAGHPLSLNEPDDRPRGYPDRSRHFAITLTARQSTCDLSLHLPRHAPTRASEPTPLTTHPTPPSQRRRVHRLKLPLNVAVGGDTNGVSMDETAEREHVRVEPMRWSDSVSWPCLRTTSGTTNRSQSMSVCAC